MIKLAIGDKVKVLGKSVGRRFVDIPYTNGKIIKFHGNGDGSNGSNCIVVEGFARWHTHQVDWYAPWDLELVDKTAAEINLMFDDIIEAL